MTLRLLDLFGGIGGFSLGLERSGAFETVAFCEIDPFCRRVLAKHWPGVPCFEDVRTLSATALSGRGIAIDAICGGFPCQDISLAGKGGGLAGERSGLWREYARLIGELRPRFVIVENVSALRSRGLGAVLGDLAALGYDAEWHCIPASAVGAPHQRDRLWIVAYPGGEQHEGDRVTHGRQAAEEFSGASPYAEMLLGPEIVRHEQDRNLAGGEGMADPDGARLEVVEHGQAGERPPTVGASGWWAAEPDVGRVAHGVPRRVDRLRSLGNSVVPQIPEMIGRAIGEALR